MAILGVTEHFTSRVTTETVRGATMEREFVMTFDVYDNDFDIFVGNLLGNSALDDDFPNSTRNLRVTQIQQRTIGDNKNALVRVFYSTINSPNIEAIPDAANSWTETFDISSVDEAVETYIDQGTGKAIDWAADWAEFKPDGASEIAPELIIRDGRTVFNLTMYASTLYINRITKSLNRINGVNFLNNYFALPPQSDIPNDWVAFDDFDQWLFTSCPITRVGKNVWRYDFTFEYSGNLAFGWNEVALLDVIRYNNKDSFTGNLFNFLDLFVGMDNNIDTDISIAVKRS